jgi:hypothetical protein
MTTPLTIIEIPHRSPPKVWTATDHDDAIARATVVRADDAESLDAALDDNHVAFVLECPDDYRHFFRTYRGHQAGAARSALRRVIRQQIGKGGLVD